MQYCYVNSYSKCEDKLSFLLKCEKNVNMIIMFSSGIWKIIILSLCLSQPICAAITGHHRLVAYKQQILIFCSPGV